MTAPVLADALGPRGRRMALVASVVATALLGLLVAAAMVRLSDKGQLDADKWRLLVDRDVLRFLLGGLGNTLDNTFQEVNAQVGAAKT